MKRWNAPLAVVGMTLFLALPKVAFAEDGMTAEHKGLGLGFHQTVAPIGVRYWFSSQKMALDLGIGFGSDEAFNGYPDETVSHWALDVGVPLVVKSWPRAHVLFRPGLLYQSQEVVISDGPPPPIGDPFDTDNQKDLAITAEIEGEAFLIDNFSVSASFGIAYESFTPADFDPLDGVDPEKETFLDTFGNNFTNIGFHLYLFK